jgi:hypothetical protein
MVHYEQGNGQAGRKAFSVNGARQHSNGQEGNGRQEFLRQSAFCIDPAGGWVGRFVRALGERGPQNGSANLWAYQESDNLLAACCAIARGARTGGYRRFASDAA